MDRTIISDSYAPFGTITSGPPDRPEPPRREPVWLTKAEILKRQRWTEADFEVAINLADPVKFPPSGKRIHRASDRIELIWRDTEIDRWDARLREHLDTLQRLVRKK